MHLIETFALLAGPFIVSLLCAFFLSRFMRNRFAGISARIKIAVAGLAGVLAPVLYLSIWQAIEVAMREARGDTTEYMGPIVFLIYGFPLFIISSALCFVLAFLGNRQPK